MPRARRSPRVALTWRDLEILWSLHQARFLTAVSIEWLHFPQWQARYEQWQQAQDGTRYVVCAQAYHVLRRLAGAGLVERIVRPAMLAVGSFQREPDLFFVTRQGAELLCEARGLELDSINYGEPRRRSYLFLAHHAEVGRVYAALRCRVESKPGLQFSGWQSEHEFQRRFDRLQVFVPGTDGSGTRQEEGIQPDGAFQIAHPTGQSLFFVEVERDQPLMKWKRKVWAYEAYLDSSQLRARFGSRTFALLGLARDAHQQKRLLQATAEALGMLYGDPQRRASAFERYMIGHMATRIP